MAFAQDKIVVLIVLSIFYGISIPLTIHWLIAYKKVANTRHKCITSRHFNTTWGYLICCICASNIGHPLSILLYWNIPTPLILICYLLSDISTFSVFYMCLIRAYMMMWDKKYNLARKEQFWTKKIVNDELESYEINEIEDDDTNNFLSPFIKYRRNLGNVQYVALFMLCILVPITLFVIASPFLFIDRPRQHRLSAIFRFVCTIPIVSALVFIYFKIPKYNEAIGLRMEVRTIVQIICGTFVSCDVLISLLFYCITNLIQLRYIMMINGSIHIVSAFLLFYTSTGLILPRLRKIITANISENEAHAHTKRRPFGLSHKLQFLVLSWSSHKTNKPNLSSLSIPPFIGNDPAISAEKKLKKTLTIWRRRKDMPKSGRHGHNCNCSTDGDTQRKVTFSAVSPPHESAATDMNEDFSFIDGAATDRSSFTNNVMHSTQTDRPFEIVKNGAAEEIEEIEEFDDEEVANISELEIEIDDARDKGYSYSKHASITIGLQSSSPAYITPQRSKTDPQSHSRSRRTSSKFNPSELGNINTTTTTVTFSGATASNKIVLPSNNNSIKSNKDTPHSTVSTPIGSIYNKARRHSLSVKDAYAGIKQIFGRNSMKSSSCEAAAAAGDPEEKIYFEIRLEDALNVVLSDQDGLSRFADHLCSEFSIENLLFIVETLQYRYCIPLALFDDLIMEREIEETETESVELLMHIIHQNKKLPISALLKQHRSCCNIESIKNISTPTQSGSQDVDFMSSSIDIETDNQEQCCKECTVEKFKYIIEKYVQTTSINLPSATQRKLMNIWNELKIKDPDKRFMLNKLNPIKKKKKKKKRKCKKKKKEDPKELEREMSQSKSIIAKIQKEIKKHQTKNVSLNEEGKVCPQIDEVKSADAVFLPSLPPVTHRQQTLSTDEHTTEQIPSHSVSPRDMTEMTAIDVNVTNITHVGERIAVASYSNADTPSNVRFHSELRNNEHTSRHSSHNSQLSMSHLTSTPRTHTTTTPTDCDEDDGDIPQPRIVKEEEEQHKQEEEEETKEEIKEDEETKKKKEESVSSSSVAAAEEAFAHDGFGNINFITVFDDAILEIVKLMKSDTWRRFKRSKQFVDWANDFKPS
eukprot:602973_1